MEAMLKIIDVHAMNAVCSRHERRMGLLRMVETKFVSQNQAQATGVTLGLLDALETWESIPQRSLALRLGVALGLTNAMLKRCLRKGLLKVRHAPARRYAYYLTPKGLREKTRLTAEYLSGSLGFYRNARSQYLDAIEYCNERNWTRIAIYGSSELVEIAIIASQEINTPFVAIINPVWNEPLHFGVPVVRDAEEVCGRVDAVIVADTNDPQAAFDEMSSRLSVERILTPPLLHVARQRANKSGVSTHDPESVAQ